MRSRPQLALGKHFERPAQRPGEEGVSHGPEARLDRHSWPEPTQATLGGAKQRVGDTPVEQGDQTRRAAHAPGRQPEACMRSETRLATSAPPPRPT